MLSLADSFIFLYNHRTDIQQAAIALAQKTVKVSTDIILHNVTQVAVRTVITFVICELNK